MKVEERLLTYEDIDTLPENCEVVEGRLRELAPTGGEHGFIEQKVARKVDEKLEQKGYVLVGEVGLLISRKPLTIRGADIVYISKDRLSEVPKGVVEVPPDLVVEIISPSNTFEEVEEKVADYMRFGVGRIVLIDPGLRKLTLIDEDRKISIMDFTQEFEILPEVKLKLSDLLGGKDG